MSDSFPALKEVADKMINATRTFVATAVDPLKTRMAAVEVRSAAMAMLLAKQGNAEELHEYEDLLARIKSLEARVATLQNMPALRYSGVWSAGRQYDVAEVVTDHGSMWHANRPTCERPGSRGEDWTLCVKRGGNG